MIPEEAYEYALKHGPSKKTRKIVCQNAFWAYLYAIDVDKKPRNNKKGRLQKFNTCKFLRNPC